MPENDDLTNDASASDARGSSGILAFGKSSFFSVPPAVKQIFDRFPLVTYRENALPIRASRTRDQHILYVFTTEADARSGRPSFNPACLKWQTCMKFAGIPFRTVPSSNHASPSGALPFLLPTATATAKAKDVVPTKGLRKWLSQQTGASKWNEEVDPRAESFTYLLENQVRKAWLYHLYLTPANRSTLRRLYIAPSSSNSIVRAIIQQQLYDAAAREVVKVSALSAISGKEVMEEVEEAFQALDTLLDSDEWFFGAKKPGFFDACVYAYTQLILDESLGWRSNTLAQLLKRHSNVVQHRERILELYF